MIFRSVIVAKLMYASPAWSGFLNAAERNRYDGFLKRSKRTGFCPTNLETFTSLCEMADDAFFSAIKNNTRHVLHHLLQDKPSSGYSLRERVHNFVLPNNINSLSDHNFLNRILYKNIFWSIKSHSIIYGLWNGTLGTLLDKHYYIIFCLLL